MAGRRGDTITLQPEIARTLARLGRLPSWERVYGANALIAEMRVAIKALSEVRLGAGHELATQHVTLAEARRLTGTRFGGAPDLHGTKRENLRPPPGHIPQDRS